jgi:hypothetical protein
MKAPKIYKYQIEIKKPWSIEMYGINKSLVEEYSNKILEAILNLTEFDSLNKLAQIINPYKYGEGYNIESARLDMLTKLTNVENYWMHKIIPQLIKNNWITPIVYVNEEYPNLPEDGKLMNLIGYENKEEILELRNHYSKNK